MTTFNTQELKAQKEKLQELKKQTTNKYEKEKISEKIRRINYVLKQAGNKETVTIPYTVTL